MPDILRAYLITFGWAIVGSVSMGLGIIIALKMFTISTRKVDESGADQQGEHCDGHCPGGHRHFARNRDRVGCASMRMETSRHKDGG